MAVKLKTGLKKTTSKTKLKTQTGIEAATKLVPSAFAIQKQMKVLQAKMKNLTDQLSPIETDIRAFVDGDLESTASVDLISNGDVLKVAGRLQTRTIKSTDDVVIALEEFEEGLALKLAKFGIGDLDKYFSPEEMDDLCEVKEGNRRLTYK